MQSGEPLRVKVELPDRQSFLENGVHQLELVLKYGDNEEQVVMIDIHSYVEELELPIIKQEELEIPILDNSYASTISFPYSPISNHRKGVVKELLDDPSPPSHPPRKKISARRRLKESTTCKICHKIFRHKSKAIRHSFVHLSQEEKEAVRQGWKNKCYFCAKRFLTPSKLDRHLLIHIKEKAHPCDKCWKQFTQKSSLTKHQHLHYPDPAIRRPFNCAECDKSFTEKGTLTRHVKVVHLRQKQFQCPECDKKFGQKGDMRKHLQSVHMDTVSMSEAQLRQFFLIHNSPPQTREARPLKSVQNDNWIFDNDAIQCPLLC